MDTAIKAAASFADKTGGGALPITAAALFCAAARASAVRRSAVFGRCWSRHARGSPVQPRARRQRRTGQVRHSRSRSQSRRRSAVCSAPTRARCSSQVPRSSRDRQPDDFVFTCFMRAAIPFVCKIRSREARAPSPRARGEGGVRGPLRWARNCGGVCNAVACSATVRIAERPPHPRRGAPRLLPARGEKWTCGPVLAMRLGIRALLHALRKPFQMPPDKRREAERR
jgi:hypothetical protein